MRQGVYEMDAKRIDELARRLAEALPEGITDLRTDMERNFRSVLQGTLARMDVVTREEFDVQTAVLARTRAKLKQLEAQVTELEGVLHIDASTHIDSATGATVCRRRGRNLPS